jgi:hypothetical protein
LLDDDRLVAEARRLAAKNQRLPVFLLLGHVSQPAKTRRIIEKGREIGFRAISDWNVTDILRVAADRNLVAQRADGWRLLDEGNGALVEAGVQFHLGPTRRRLIASCRETCLLAREVTLRK